MGNITRLITAALYLLGASDAREPQIYEPGRISTASYESHPAFSPDGNLLLFVRSTPEFRNWKIYETSRSNSGWSQPVLASFGGQFLDADPQFSRDGRQLFFISTRPAPDKLQNDLDIWVVSRVKGGWGTPKRLPSPINSAGAEWFPRTQPDGSLYFGSDRPGGRGSTDIYRAVRTLSGWRVTNLDAPVNSAADEYELELSPDGKTGILMATRDPSSGGDLYRVIRTKNGWSQPQRLGPAHNGPGREVGPLISYDGKRLYFSSDRSPDRLGDIYVAALSAAR